MRNVEINGTDYKVGYAKEVNPGVWSLGVHGKRGGVFMTTWHQTENRFTKLVRA